MIILVILATLIGGIWVDTLGRPWSQPATAVWAWSSLIWLARRAGPSERRELAICVLLATLGELFLGFVWGLYEYRLGNLPLFIPPGHALVYAAGRRVSIAAPGWLAPALSGVLAPYCVMGAVWGWDTQGPAWYLLFLSYVLWGNRPSFYATMFLFAFLIEAYGTGLGGWRYHAREPWFGLTTLTNPPVWTGVFYCTLDALVLATCRNAWRARLGRWREIIRKRPRRSVSALCPSEASQ
jgi:hypothetical protein